MCAAKKDSRTALNLNNENLKKKSVLNAQKATVLTLQELSVQIRIYSEQKAMCLIAYNAKVVQIHSSENTTHNVKHEKQA